MMTIGVLIQLILRELPSHFRRILLSGLLVAAIFGVLSVARPTRYTSTLKIAPASTPEGASGGLASLASQFGIRLGTQASEPLPQVQEILTGWDFAAAIAAAYITSAPNGDVSARCFASQRRQHECVRLLKRSIGASINRDANVLVVRISWHDSLETVHLHGMVHSLLQREIIHRRQANATEERRFLEERLAATERDIVRARQALIAFLRENATYTSSPALSAEADRLRAEVEFTGSVRVSLQGMLEQARLSEEKSKAPFVAVDGANPIVQRASLTTPLAVALGFLSGSCLYILLSMGSMLRAVHSRPELHD